jgi:hypothetical protein
LFERKTTADVQTILDTFVNSQVDDPETVSSETTKYGNKTAKQTLLMPLSQSLALFNYPPHREAQGYQVPHIERKSYDY